MKEAPILEDLQESIQDKSAFKTLRDYLAVSRAFLKYLRAAKLTRINSPSHWNYMFFQYGDEHGSGITRPLNKELFIESIKDLDDSFARFVTFLGDLKKHKGAVVDRPGVAQLVKSNEINRLVYTVQQSIGSVGDSFANANQCRKRIGQLFENLITLVIREIGFSCEPRTINLPIPDNPGTACHINWIWSFRAIKPLSPPKPSISILRRSSAR